MNPQVGQIFRRGRITREVKHDGENASFVTCLEVHADGYQRIVRPMRFQWQRWVAKAEQVAA